MAGALNTHCCGPDEQHPDHSKSINRINRIVGQLEGIKRMIEERRYCPDILVQTKAIKSAIASLEAKILEGHLQSCVKEAMSSSDELEQQRKVDELVKLYLDRR